MKEFRCFTALLKTQGRAVAVLEEGKEAGRSTVFQWDSSGGGARQGKQEVVLSSPDLPGNSKDFVHTGEAERTHFRTSAG